MILSRGKKLVRYLRETGNSLGQDFVDAGLGTHGTRRRRRISREGPSAWFSSSRASVLDSRGFFLRDLFDKRGLKS